MGTNTKQTGQTPKRKTFYLYNILIGTHTHTTFCKFKENASVKRGIAKKKVKRYFKVAFKLTSQNESPFCDPKLDLFCTSQLDPG